MGKHFQHRTNSSKKLCGLHLQGDLSPSQMPRQRGTCEPQRQYFLGFPLQHRRLPPPVLLMGAFVWKSGGTSLGACAKKQSFKTRGLGIPSISNRMEREGKWQICNHHGFSCKSDQPGEAGLSSVACSWQGQGPRPRCSIPGRAAVRARQQDDTRDVFQRQQAGMVSWCSQCHPVQMDHKPTAANGWYLITRRKASCSSQELPTTTLKVTVFGGGGEERWTRLWHTSLLPSFLNDIQNANL